MGAIASVEHAVLGELEMDVLAWFGEEWWRQGASVDGTIRFTWYQLGRDLWNRKPGGHDHEAAREAVDNLLGALVTLSGYNAITGEMTPAAFSKVHILRDLVVDDAPSALGPTGFGAARGETVRVRLEEWLVGQMLGDVTMVLDWKVQRELTGAAHRLWCYLGARNDDFVATSWPDRRELRIPLTPSTIEGFGLTSAQAVKNRAALERAGAKIVKSDPRYVSITIEKPAHRGGTFTLRAVVSQNGTTDIPPGEH